ncbi:MAG: hypothetical protein ACRC0X_07720, partial [Brevinema sp.]
MIELLASVKIQQQAPLVHKNNNTDHSFQDRLDQSLSQQKSLQEELNQQKVDDQQKEINKIEKKIQTLKKEELEYNNTESDILSSLEQIIAFLQEGLSENKNSEDMIPSEEEFNLEVWTDDMLVVLQKTIDHLEQVANPFILQKTAFILEDNPTEQILVSVLQDLKQSLENIQELPNFSKLSDSGIITMDENLVALDSAELVAMDSIVSANNKEVPKSTSTFESSDFESPEEQKFEIKDFRVAQEKTLVVEDQQISEDSPNNEPLLTLETIDSEVPTIRQEQTIKNIAQQVYTSLSSAVSRVQVEALMQNITGKISMILHEGGNELRMRMTPPELGQMRLSFVSEDGMMRGKVIVETP